MFYGDIDEVVVAPFVERRNLTSLSMMATPFVAKYAPGVVSSPCSSDRRGCEARVA